MNKIVKDVCGHEIKVGDIVAVAMATSRGGNLELREVVEVLPEGRNYGENVKIKEQNREDKYARWSYASRRVVVNF